MTGLANRRSFSETLAGCCLLPRGDDAFALIMLDLDRFKFVNDTLGHQAGDLLLQQVGMRLRCGRTIWWPGSAATNSP